MADKYGTRQHQPLRTPTGWGASERSLLMQLEELLDDIYTKFGRIGLNDQKRGIKITMNGATWEINDKGMKYTKLSDPLPFQIGDYEDRETLANGLFYNFSSTNQTGEVILTSECQNGEHTSPSGFWRGEVAFAMTDNLSELDADAAIGIFYPKTGRASLGTRSYPWTYLFARDIIGKAESGTNTGVIGFSPHPDVARRQNGVNFQEQSYDDSGVTKQRVSIVGNNANNQFLIIGNAQDSNQLHGFGIISGAKYITGDSGNNMFILRPNGAAGKQNVRIVVNESESSGQQIMNIYADSGVDELRFHGRFVGNASSATTASKVTCTYEGTDTDLNNYTENGRHWFNMSSASHGPSTMTAGAGILDVIKLSAESTLQILYDSVDSIYKRSCLSGTWGSWYRFTGTAV